MSAISNFITAIRTAVYGEQVRGAIADAIEQCYSDVSSPSLNQAGFDAAIASAYANGILDIQTVTQISAMTNDKIIYRYNGTETGKNKGLYYYSPITSTWVLLGSEVQEVSLANQMTNTKAIYKYTGTETGMVQNSLYCHNGTAWLPIGSGVLTAGTAALMTNTGAIYKYTGNETGYVQNALYYHNGTSWVLISPPLVTDADLLNEGEAADAKATGVALATKATKEDVGTLLGVVDKIITAFEGVAYVDDNGQDLIDDIIDAVYNEDSALSLSASPKKFYVLKTNATDDEIKAALNAEMQYTYNRSRELSDFSVSASLSAGMNAVSVSASGKTASTNLFAIPTTDLANSVYTTNLLSGKTWSVGSYGFYNGTETSSANHARTGKFTVPAYLLYKFQAPEGTGDPYIFEWDENGNYMGCFSGYGNYAYATLNPRFTYAVVFYDSTGNGTSKGSSCSLTPVDNRLTMVAPFEVDVNARFNTLEQTPTRTDFTFPKSLFSEFGITEENYLTAINSCNVTFIGNMDRHFGGQSEGVGVWTYINQGLYLRFDVSGYPHKDDLKEYLKDNHLVFKFNFQK